MSGLRRYRIRVRRRCAPRFCWIEVEALSERDAEYRVTRIDAEAVEILDMQPEWCGPEWR